MQMCKINGYNQQSSRKKDTVFTSTNVFTTGVILILSSSTFPLFACTQYREIRVCYKQTHAVCQCLYFLFAETSADTSEVSAIRAAPHVTDSKDTTETKRKYWKMIFGEEAMTISPKEPYCIHCAIRRGHFNVSPHYSAQQVYIVQQRFILTRHILLHLT